MYFSIILYSFSRGIALSFLSLQGFARAFAPCRRMASQRRSRTGMSTVQLNLKHSVSQETVYADLTLMHNGKQGESSLPPLLKEGGYRSWGGIFFSRGGQSVIPTLENKDDMSAIPVFYVAFYINIYA